MTGEEGATRQDRQREGSPGSEARGSAERLARLRAATRRLGRSPGRGTVERWLALAGGGLAVAGVAVVVLGWYGAAHTPYVFEQVPYLISGGILGLALAVVGGFAYFGSWVARQVQETRRQAERTREELAAIHALLAGGGFPGGGRAAGPAAANGGYVATAKGTMFHRPDCVVVAGREDVRRVRAGEPGLEPCRVCDPLAVGR
jgi:hypothetical protein